MAKFYYSIWNVVGITYIYIWNAVMLQRIRINSFGKNYNLNETVETFL